MPKPMTEGGEKNLIARRLVQLRKLRGLSQRQLAARLQLEGYDMDKNVITRIETGKRYVTDIELAALCQVLEVSCGYLLYGDEEKYKYNERPAANAAGRWYIYGISSVGAVLAALDLEFIRIVGYAMLVVVILYCRLHGLLGQDGAVYLMGRQAVQGSYHCLV